MKKIICTLFIFGLSLQYSAQDLLAILDKETPQVDQIVTATFKGTRILNGHSIENRKDKELEFLISHRFGRVNLGFDELFGLDQSNIRFALEYGLNDDLTIGLGRSSFEKTYDSFLKYSVLKQKKGANSFPFAVSLFGSIALKTIKDFDPSDKRTFAESLF